MPYNALEWNVSVQMNVTRAGFAASYFVSYTYWQPVPQRIISANVDRGIAAGINAEATEKGGQGENPVYRITKKYVSLNR